ncbi:DoxX family membrane protein [Gleimia sp. 6138-11-ORH1]|uniref:DoxX family membrane protein n=1 Tax=Gleimia sp. 6138-11-ORH1 TaxID=2973937 RepID=UPI00216817CE|nr:DoxX family membrane protein [Gleimia sp. 6138-11-ORH1]MCS4484071.1 DoxX family membrane protein [Gleimia sp. 6138-11-ORH1]
MSLLRFTARTLLALPFLVDGIDAIQNPQSHGQKLQRTLKSVKGSTLPEVSKEQATQLSRLAGVATVTAAAGLVLGKAPRTCATLLACTAIPIAVVQNPVWTAADKTERNQYRRGLERYGAVFGGLVFAAFDRKGAPSASWRLSNWKQQRQTLNQLKETPTV